MSKKTKLILGIVFAVILLGAGGYLLWRTNQEETVAPADSDAATGYRTECLAEGGLALSCAAAKKVTCGANQEAFCGGYPYTMKDLNITCSGYKWDCKTKTTSTPATQELLSCGASGCVKDADCAGYTEGTHECDEVVSGDASQQFCVRLTCPTGQELADDRCTCVDSASCGDDICDADESVESCPEDCDASCGDGFCTHDETAESCPEDCDEEEEEVVVAMEEVVDVPDSTPEAGLFDDMSRNMKLGFVFILFGILTTQVHKLFGVYDIVLDSREIRITKSRRGRVEKNF